jgi:hypothetical protein
MTVTQPKFRVSHTPHGMTEGLSGRPSRLAASRILSETAHDLRSPLTTVRETIRFVACGELGPVNESQQQCLVDAIDICDSMERLVTDMLQLERLQTGWTRAMRTWFDLEPVCYNVAATLESTLRQRKISIAWDGIETTTPRVFGDPDKINRLLCNLISNAARETAENHCILVRARQGNDSETLKLYIVDSGKGMDPETWERVAQRGISKRGSESLGLSICRQLAAAHHSPLTILSRLGQGTEVSFELPIGGATSVAAQWAQWRQQQRGLTLPRRRDEIKNNNEDVAVGIGNHRAFMLPESQMLLLGYDGSPPRHPNSAIMLSVSIGAAVPRKAIEAFNQKLQRDQRAFDLVYRVSDRRWVVVWDANQSEVEARIESLAVADSELPEVGLRLNWSHPKVLSLATHNAAVLLADMLTREALHDREPVGLLDDDMSLDGGTKFAPSPIPAERLRAELTHLATRVERQSQTINRQARSANPGR